MSLFFHEKQSIYIRYLVAANRIDLFSFNCGKVSFVIGNHFDGINWTLVNCVYLNMAGVNTIYGHTFGF